MKKTSFLLLTLLLVSSVVLAQEQQGSQGQATGTMNFEQSQQVQSTDQEQQVQTEQETQNQGEESQLMIQQRTQLEVQKLNEAKQSVQQRQQEMNQEIQQLEEGQQKIYQNQNQVRLAVHSLLAMEDLVGGVGPQVSQIAKEFDNSVQTTIVAEEKIKTRNSVVMFFMGGDKESAGLIEQEVNENQERIQQLKELREQCDCGEEVKDMFQEQIANMEQEQNRLEELAQNEKGYGNVFSRMFNWVKSLF